MLGLMLKDLYNLKWSALGLGFVFIALALILSFSSDNMTLTVAGVVVGLCYMFPSTIMSMDEKDNWNRIALTMPVARRDMVLSKYALCLAFCLLAATGFLLCCLLAVPWTEAVIITGNTFWGAVILLSLLLPLMFKLGVNYTYLAFILLPFLVFLLGLSGHGDLIEGALYAIAHMSILNRFFLLSIILALSISLSLKAYARKEF